ncbi:hypothetical protein DXV75_12310 [Alteromonas aestuariivivens]|uniref:Flagellar biosynthesis protein FlgE n=1 Tax=Alteromonas aestuariivivens TaxID=1938339 RepID=A0A3D8M5E9_9ALTE|nr:hypothetical protein [Alteromonas aestuariivivens]RDV24851.1 hypothetical protein DXV75_12310 [Alteromonas aestuariivivens]
MSGVVDNHINSAIISSQFGLNKAYQGVTQASMSIAQRTAQQSVEENGPGQVLAKASLSGLQNIRQMLPASESSPMADLVSLKLHSVNAQASAKVMDKAYDTVGTIIDILT